MRAVLLSGVTVAFISFIGFSSAAHACNGSQCFERVVTPPVYATKHHTVMTQAPQTIAHVKPARYGTVSETVMVQPPRHIKHVIPGEMQTVAERVMVSPPSRRWEVTVDHHGRTVGCWVEVPAQYTTRYRQVMTRAPSVAVQHVPAVLATQHRTVMVRPATVHHQHIPAQYGTISRTVQVAPATASWQPMH